MTCWQCGAPLPPDVGFCRACGAFVRPRDFLVTGSGVARANAPQAPIVPSPASTNPAGSSPVWTSLPPTAWTPASPMTRPGLPSGVSERWMVSDVVAAAGTGLVLISMFLSWYDVTLTSLGVQFYDSLERALFSRLFPQIATGLGGLTGPLTFPVSAVGKGAGGWRWAILVVSIVLLLEVIVSISSGAAGPASPGWPHTPILLTLTVTNLVLVVAAFLSQPYSGTPSSYVTVAPGLGAYLGLLAALVACGGGVARSLKNSPRTVLR